MKLAIDKLEKAGGSYNQDNKIQQWSGSKARLLVGCYPSMKDAIKSIEDSQSFANLKKFYNIK